MIHIQVEMEDLLKIESALNMARDKSKMILRNAINNTAKQTESRMADGAKSRYRYKKGNKSDIRKANSIEKASAGKLSSTIRAKGPVNELLDFHVQPGAYYPGGKGAPKWVRARVLRGSRLSRIALRPGASGDKYKGFVVRYPTGHMALAQRVPGEHMKSNPRKELLRSLLSISTPKMEETVYKEEVSEGMYDLLEKNIEEQMKKFLK
ncbi:MAG: hypothetical protein HDR08_01790 [Lachnospiraceae bacterium]|nr:hypothetical protein [Lachnospiraceae bacterium]